MKFTAPTSRPSPASTRSACGRKRSAGEIVTPISDPKRTKPMLYDITEEFTEFFTREKLRCACGCDECDLDRRLVPSLEHLRKLAGYPEIEIVVGYRCGKANHRAKGVSKAAHMDGRAVDLRIAGLSL